MRFVIVSDRTPRTHSVCARCAKPIDVGYLREFVSNLRIVTASATEDAEWR